MKWESTLQLVHMKKTLLDQGVNCLYLSKSLQESNYHMNLMAWLFRFEEINKQGKIIVYPKASLFFKAVSIHPNTLRGYRASIIPDHGAFRETRNPYRQDFLDIIKQSKRYEHP